MMTQCTHSNIACEQLVEGPSLLFAASGTKEGLKFQRVNNMGKKKKTSNQNVAIKARKANHATTPTMEVTWGSW